MTRLPFPKTIDLECPLCHTTHVCPVESDEDGFYGEIETQACNDDHCTKQLCSCCQQFTCECCNGTFCLEPSHVGQETEPECACVRTGDQDDTRGCESHGSYPRPTIYLCRTCAAVEEGAEVEPINVGFEAAFEQMKEVA